MVEPLRVFRALVRETLIFQHRAMEMGSMLRCMATVAAAFMLCIFAGYPAVAPSAAIGAFICGFISLEGIYRSRIVLIACTALGLASASFIGETIQSNVAALVLVAALVGYANGIFAAFSRGTGAISLYATAAFIIYSHLPLTQIAIRDQSTAILFGAGLQIIVFTIFAPLSRFTFERRALGGSFTEIAAFAELPVSQSAPAPPAHALIAARQLLADPQPFGRARDVARFRRLLHNVHVLRKRIAGLRALPAPSAAGSAARAALLHAAGRQIRLVADLLAARHTSAAVAESDAELRRAFKGFEAAFADQLFALSLGRSMLVVLRDSLQGATVISGHGFSPFLFIAAPRPDAYIHPHWNFRNRDALRLSIVLGVAMLIGHTLFIAERGYWIALTAVLILKPDLRTTAVRTISRIGGTLVGAVLTLIAFRLHPNPNQLELSLLGSGAVCYLTFYANYGIFSIAVTVFVMSFLRLIGAPSDASITARVIDTLVGGGLALAGYMVLPTFAHERIREVLADLLAAQAEFADRVLAVFSEGIVADPGDLERLRTRAWKLRIDAEQLIDRSRFERDRGRSLPPARSLEILGATQSYALLTLALEAGLDSMTAAAARPLVADFRVAMREELTAECAALRDGRSATVPSTLASRYQTLARGHDPTNEIERFLLVHCKGYAQILSRMHVLCHDVRATA